MVTSGRQRGTRRHFRGKSDFAPIDDIALFSDALKTTELAPGSSAASAERLIMLRIVSAWARAVGPHLKAVAQPTGLREGRLVIDVRDAGWKRELERARPEVLDRMIRLLPDHPIRDLTFRLKSLVPDHVSSVGSPGPPPVPAARLLDLPRPAATRPATALTRTHGAETTQELSDRLQQVMGRYLARNH